MNLIDEKRKELEKFIEEQMIGPGGCAGRFGKDGLGEQQEVLNTTPGNVYNTAILFPEKAEDIVIDEQQENDNQEENESVTDEVADQTIDEKDQNSGNSDHDDNFSIERRFPNVMAISCCLNEKVDLKQDVKIHITGRYYRKIEGDDRKKVYILIPYNRCDILRKHLDSDEIIKDSFNLDESKLYAKFADREAASDISVHVKELNKKWSREIRDFVHSKVWGNKLFENVKEEHLLLSVCRRNLFDKLKNKNTDTKYAVEIKQLIDKIGQYEQSIQDMQDLIALYTGDNYGYWESKPVYWPVDLSQIPFEEDRRSYTPQNGCPSLKLVQDNYSRRFSNEDHNIEMSLSVLLQITKDNRNPANRNKYFKVMLKNSTTPFVETQKDHYKIVNEELNKSCFFGMKIELESEFLEPYTYKKEQGYQDVNKEEDRLKFLYRDIYDYGVGHLCSVNWDKKSHKVWSEFLPTCDVPDVEFTPRNKRADWVPEVQEDKVTRIVPPPFLDKDDCLSLHRLSTFSGVADNDIREDLKMFVGNYQEWINLLPDLDQENERYGKFAQYTKKQCQIDCDRMSENISLILSDDENLHIFRLMNSAMLMQMWHNKVNYGQVQLPIIPDFYSDKGTTYKWRPFQLAFILLNLDGIIQRDDDTKWEKRNECVDLVWFPTGGGKTEAYLGIIALTIINRRRKYGNEAGGTTAIMRYTLRLLATQQFERALKLILALDQIRIWGNDPNNPNYDIGKEPVSIGLFVGKSSLPNTYEDLNTEAGKWTHRNEPRHENTNIPLDKCPWCGGDLTWSARGGARYKYGRFAKQFHCHTVQCTFRQRLPVQLCDEQIYTDPPTLLFGTVDKFAQLARKVSTSPESIKNDSRRLFGVGEGVDYLTPDLIIQDELHLLLGPLGSAVSLFEAAIDQLCTRTTTNSENQEIKVRPKIISSTATTRNTELQIRALYDRGINIFPKSGVDYDDSFFAFYKRQRIGEKEEWISKRRYKGVMPTGRTQMLMQLRLAAILFVHRAIFEKDYCNDDLYNSAADNYYSIISYFNSLKEVGKTDAQYPYEFTKYLQRLYSRVMGHCGLLDCFYADENTLTSEELTGRLSGPQVVSTLDKVQQEFDVNHRLPHIENGKLVYGTTPPDYILATNMISVGIDVDRFNTIIMNSMPRNIAEYIQASSRVARKHKGLVLTSHNPFRVRDTSHYEKFIEFHEKMYYYVDPISITPFSNKAIEKYLPLYLATIIRHRLPNLQNKTDAGNVVNTVQDVKDYLKAYFRERKNRTQAITNLDSELETMLRNLLDYDMNQVIDRFIDDAIQQWNDLAKKQQDLWYYNDNPYQTHDDVLFSETEEYDGTRSEYWTVPNSLRIVEPEAVLKIQNLY